MLDYDIGALLHREPMARDTEPVRATLVGRRILTTGAGGSVGSELCRQILRFEPKELCILGHGENRIFYLERELRAMGTDVKIVPVIADVANPERIDRVFREFRPELVFHAAAHKHVPLMETNVAEAIHNNVYGTKTLADAAIRHGVAKFLLISTDKAVNPTSVMGCAKLLAERCVTSLAGVSATEFIVTRFGNVLGSNGSVVSIFREQIEKGGPITITDRRMTRYFMTIPEAAQLVLDAVALGDGGGVYIFDMGEPTSIEELAKEMIRRAGLSEKDVEIREIGLRPGEKLCENLLSFDSEKLVPTKLQRVLKVETRRFDHAEFERQLAALMALSDEPDEAIRKKMRELVPEYAPPEPER